ncbi:MAG: CDP-glycerol glycerophosphotransferase family protein, partial [Actinomycetes bacterium]
DRLGIAAEKKIVLYAPTYRPDRRHRASRRAGLDRYRSEVELDLDAVRGLLGDDHVLLVRPHPKTVDAVPEADGHTVVDVSRWPDVQELLLASDVLVTDWSAIMVDFAVTGRPMVLWDDDPRRADGAEGHAASIHPFLDVAAFPGPVVTESDQLVEAALSALDSSRDDTAYRAFVETWCPGVDGKAAARAVDVLLEA